MRTITILQTNEGLKGMYFYANGYWFGSTFDGEQLYSADREEVIRFVMRGLPIRSSIESHYIDSD